MNTESSKKMKCNAQERYADRAKGKALFQNKTKGETGSKMAGRAGKEIARSREISGGEREVRR